MTALIQDAAKKNASAYVERIDARLQALVPKALPGQSGLDAAIRQSVLSPGKRLRPLMTALAAEDLGGDLETAIDAGCAIEMIHAASLILDDLPSMDDAVLRRGQPAAHVAHGEDVAILSSIAILTGAIGMVSTMTTIGAEARLEMISVLTDAIGVEGLVGGQFADLRGGREARLVKEIAATNSLKTGSLFSAAVEIGAIVAGAEASTRAALRDFASELGHAFQLLDDLLDVENNAVAIGKDVGQDAGKSTIVSILGRATSERQIERHVEAANASLTSIFGASSRLHVLTKTIFDQAGHTGAPSSMDDAGEREAEAGVR